MTIHLCAFHRYEETTLRDLARVYLHAGNLGFTIADNSGRLDVLKQFAKFHISQILFFLHFQLQFADLALLDLMTRLQTLLRHVAATP